MPALISRGASFSLPPSLPQAPALPGPRPPAHLAVANVPGCPGPHQPQPRAHGCGPGLAAGVGHRHVVVAAVDEGSQACRARPARITRRQSLTGGRAGTEPLGHHPTKPRRRQGWWRACRPVSAHGARYAQHHRLDRRTASAAHLPGKQTLRHAFPCTHKRPSQPGACSSLASRRGSPLVMRSACTGSIEPPSWV